MGEELGHEDVIQVNEYTLEILQDGVHQPLKYLSLIGKAKRCAEKLEKAEKSYHCCLGNVHRNVQESGYSP